MTEQETRVARLQAELLALRKQFANAGKNKSEKDCSGCGNRAIIHPWQQNSSQPTTQGFLGKEETP